MVYMTNLGRFLLRAAWLSVLGHARLLPRERTALSVKHTSNPNSTARLKAYAFQQRTNHFFGDISYGPPPGNTTFSQRYFLNDEFYRPSGPVIVLLGGETSADARIPFLSTGIVAQLAKATNGLALVLEHRYYGESYPVADLSTDNLRWLTTEQSIADVAYFAQHVVFPGHVHRNLNAPGTPWILYGGSLAGAEVAFTLKEYGHIIYGGISSSGTIKTALAYPEWYYPIQKYAPQDCVKSIEDIVSKIDHVIESKKAITQLQEIFGLGDLQDIRDFARTIAFPIGNPYNYPVDTWQEMNWDPATQPSSGPSFYHFCQSITNSSSPADIRAVDYALSEYTDGAAWTNLGNYAQYIKTHVNILCPTGVSVDSNECFGTHNATSYTDISLTAERSWLYQSCLEIGGFTQGAPASHPSLISRVIQPSYTQRWCKWAFPPGSHSTIPPTPNIARWNKYGGMGIQLDRLAQVDGARDPWLYNCVHSSENRQSERISTLLRPYYLITEGIHHWDENGLADTAKEPIFIRHIHDYEIKFVRSWLADFKTWKPAGYALGAQQSFSMDV